MIRFTIPGEPVGKGRPRAVRSGNGRPRMYTPPKTAQYEALVRQSYKFSFPGEKPLTGALALEIRAYMPIPESWTQGKKAKALCGEIKPAKRPDLDNIIKAVSDGLNGAAWEDDNQIIWIKAAKEYSALPRVEVEICPV